VKIALAMRAVDLLAAELLATFGGVRMFSGIAALISEFAHASKSKCETLRTDPDIFDVWTSFVVSGEKLTDFEPELSGSGKGEHDCAAQGKALVRSGKDLIAYITRARVPMPKSTREFIEKCERFRTSWKEVARPAQSVACVDERRTGYP
jgi:hypothetical protein